MLMFDINNNSDDIVVTLTELTTILSPIYYLFVFTHIETKEQVIFILSDSNDQSNFKYRFNKWTINTSVAFQGKPQGHYLYEVFEQNSNTDITTTGKNAVENGKMILTGDVFSFEQYTSSTNYKSYNG